MWGMREKSISRGSGGHSFISWGLIKGKKTSYCVRVAGRRQWHPTPVLLPGKSHGCGAWWVAVHGVATSQTRLSDFTFTFHFHALEKEMATYSTVLAWRIPGTGEPGGLPNMGSHRVGHDWGDLAAAAAAGIRANGLAAALRGKQGDAPGPGSGKRGPGKAPDELGPDAREGTQSLIWTPCKDLELV